jgi:hypothetical protein
MAWMKAVCIAVAAAATGLPLRAEPETRAYFFGNSLVHHLSGSDETAVPHWLAQLARADGRAFAADGRWGFLRDFARDLPPQASWSFASVPRAWEPERTGFGAAGFDAVVITPANFIQYQPPDAPYADGDGSPLEASLAVIDWIASEAPGTPVLIYEGWADMGGFTSSFPPSARELGRYHAYGLGAYHLWFEEYAEALRSARPGQEIRLLPVAQILSRLFTTTVLSEIPAEALYVDDAPHGTPTLYLLAAMITYAGLFDRPPPPDFVPPETIHPVLRREYAETASFITEALGVKEAAATVQGATGGGEAGPALAMGLNGIADWSTQHPFLDLMKTARPWVGHAKDRWGAFPNDQLTAMGLVDPQGWPLALPEGADRLEALILTGQPVEAVSLKGRYRLTYEGKGEIDVGGRVSDIRRSPGEIWFRYTPGEGSVAVTLRALDPADPIREIKVVHEDHLELDEAGALFNPDWIARISEMRALRFMDWMATNHSPQASWEGRPLVEDASYAMRGVPVEVMVALANEIGADPWFCMPHMADDGYVRAFAAYVHDHLDPRLKAHVEYSNETWNFTFAQTRWLVEQAQARWGARAGDDAWIQLSGLRAAEMGRIWAEVFGDDADVRLVRVVAVHTGWLGLEEAQLAAPLAHGEGSGFDPSEVFDAYAVSGYFGYDMGTDAQAETVRGWLAQGYDEAAAHLAAALREGSLKELLGLLYPYHAEVAVRHGLDLIVYEGGTHLVGSGAQIEDPGITAFFTRFNYSDEMAALYRTLLDGWRAAGGTLFTAFVDVAPASKWGSWGALRHLDDDNPRWQVLMDYNAQTLARWENRDTGTFAEGTTKIGGADSDVLTGTPEEDTLIGAEGDDILVTNGGSDRLHGGAGLDAAVLPGAPQDYIFTREGPFLLARGKAAFLHLRDVELIQFSGDPAIILDAADLP